MDQSMWLANGMMYMDSLRMQHEQMQRMYDYEYFYRNKRKSYSFQMPKERSEPIGPLYGDFKFKPTDVVEFPIESYDVLAKRVEAMLNIEDGFLVAKSDNDFDWTRYEERIWKGLQKIDFPLITYVNEKNSLVDVLEHCGFQKTDKMKAPAGYNVLRLQREGTAG